MNKEQHIEAVDNALDALAADPDVSPEEYVDALEDIRYRVDAAATAARS